MGLFDFLKEKPKTSTAPFQLGNLIEVLQDGVCISNLTGDLIYLNNAGYELLKISREEEVGKYNFFSGFIQDIQLIKKIKDTIYKDGLVKNFELQLKTRKDTELNVILTVNYIGDYRQQPIGFLFLFKDITEIKKIQQQLLQSQKLESVGLMASGIAHDFNNILAAIIPNAELIKISVPNESENYKRAEIIEKSALRASDIAKKLLTFTRDQKQQKQLVNLNDIIKESIELVRTSISDFIDIHMELEDGLHSITADPTQIQQVLVNMVINAKDAMPNGGTIHIQTSNCFIEPHIQEVKLQSGHYVKLSIEDTGTGIPIEILPKIFDPFFTTKEVGKGTGLGLSMVYGIIRSHHGSIDVYSEENRGTKFEILLPADERSIAKPLEKLAKPGLPRGLNLLVVDDEPYVRDILADILIFLGSNVIKAQSGKEAIEIYAKDHKKIDYVIIDLRMPKMDGRVTLEALKQINPRIKAIFTSGFDDRHGEEYSNDNILGFLRKPYSIQNVSKSLEYFLQNEHSRKNQLTQDGI